MKRIVDYIMEHAASRGNYTAAVCGDQRCTYAELGAAIERRAKELRSNNDECQASKTTTAMVFRATQSIEFLVDYFACHLAGYVAVPLEADVPVATFTEICRRCEEASFSQDTADVLFTTGTTGRPKGVIISHRTISSNAENLIDAQGFSPELTFIICGPLNHIGSLSKCYPTLQMGGTLLITPGMKEPNLFFSALEQAESKRVATFLVPANIRILLQFAEERLNSFRDKIEFIETGAAPISEEDMQHLCRTLPNSRLYNTYASTETGIIATHDFQAGPCIAGCLGRTMKHSELSIEDGRIVCRGSTLMSGYLGDSELTATMLKNDALYTNDCGWVDEEGRLHLSGRTDDLLNVGGYKVNPVEVEDLAMKLTEIADCICISAPHPVLGNALKLLYTLRSPNDAAVLKPRQIAQHLMLHMERYKVPTMYEKVEHIERTFNGKLNRKAYIG